MGLFDGFPFTNTHQLNLDWILQEMKKISDGFAVLQEQYSSLQQDVSSLDAEHGTQTAVELWLNAAPTSAFLSQIVQLADAQANCDMLMILVRDYADNDVTFPVFVSREGGYGIAQTGYLTEESWDYYTHDKGYRVFRWEDRYLNVSDASANDLGDDAACIPVAVYGFNLKY